MAARPRIQPALPLLAALLAAAPALALAGAPDPLAPAGTGGLPLVDRALARLATSCRVLVVGAHPDDEDGSALAWATRERGCEAAYLSLSRGEGGQNLIGPELGAALGVLRTNELLSARRIDGGRQFFTRAFDFGYTRSLDETLRLWPREALFEDAVRVVRRFRPQVILSVFGDDGSGGHGQHQAAGFVAHRVSDLAADPAFAPATGAPWRPSALYRSAWFAPEKATASAPLGGVDPLTGQSTAQVMALSRSQHRSQDMGRGLDLGARDGKYTWEAGGAGAAGADLLAGVDTSLAALADLLPEGAERTSARARLARIEAAAHAARAALAPARLAAAAAALDGMRAELAALGAELAPVAGAEGLAGLVAEKARIADEAALAARGVALDATVDREELVPGETAKLAVTVWNSGAERLGAVVVEASLGGFAAGRAERPEGLGPGELARLEIALAVPEDLAPTAPYYLRRPLAGALYDWSAAPEPLRGEPFDPPVVQVALRIADGSRSLPAALVEREAVHRRVDQALGEVRRPLRVVPKLEVSVAPERTLVTLARPACAPVEVTLVSNAAAPLEGRLEARPEGGGAAPAPQPFALPPHGRALVSVPQTPCPPGDGGRITRYVAVLDGGGESAAAYPVIDYPHVRPIPFPRLAEAQVVPLDLVWPDAGPVGYVEGASDRVPEALAEAGLRVTPLGERDLADGDLSRFRVIVVGSRAYEAQAWLGKANVRLLDWVRAGGRLVVQYQQYPWVEGGWAPLPVEISRPHDRITDERSPVVLLDPADPIFTTPNRIGPGDFDGWVQERGLYLLHGWDAGFRPLLELKDPDQPAQRGALLVAPLGKGTYVYSGLAFFRQLPAGVPGAFRLFANLLAPGPSGPESR